VLVRNVRSSDAGAEQELRVTAKEVPGIDDYPLLLANGRFRRRLLSRASDNRAAADLNAALVDELDVIAVESTGSYAAGLVRYLRGRGVRVVEVNQPHAHTRRRRGKSDAIDAELAARQALAGKATTVRSRPTGSSNRSGSCGSRARAP
jgi:transposase